MFESEGDCLTTDHAWDSSIAKVCIGTQIPSKDILERREARGEIVSEVCVAGAIKVLKGNG